MYFPQMGDSTNNIPFKLTIWKNISNNTIIYQQQVFPVHTITDKFHTYFSRFNISINRRFLYWVGTII